MNLKIFKYMLCDHGDSSVGIDSYNEAIELKIEGRNMSDEFYENLRQDFKTFLEEYYTESTIVKVYTQQEWDYMGKNEYEDYMADERLRSLK